MKLINGSLFLEYSEMIDCGINENTLRQAKLRNSSSWEFIPDPADKRKVLIGYDKLKDTYKQMVQTRFGNPYDYIAKEPLRRMVETDFKAQEFFLQYKYDGNKQLPIDQAKKYIKAANWLNLLTKLNANKKIITKELGLTLDQFFIHVCDIIKIDDIQLPSSYSRLKIKLKEYQEKGYECLIHGGFGNKLAAKISDDVSESMLLEMIAHPMQHDDEMIALKYNGWAIENGYKPITRGAVSVHRKKNEHKLLGFREGNAAWYNKFGKVIHRNRPSAPLLLVGSDDNDLDLYFIEITLDEQGRKKTNKYFRYKLIVVMDAFNDYILGYSFGDEVTIKLIKAAYLDAVYHIKELTNGWYLPHQIQTDRWGVDKGLTTELARFYQSLATYTPATVKLARSKYIERAFGSQWHQQLKFYPNYAGTNVTSKGRLNRDNLELTINNFPSKADGVHQIEDFITRMRMLPCNGGIPKQQLWLDAFNASELSKEKCISDKKMLMLFGTPHIVANHRYPEFPNKITKNGIEATINGRSLVYDVPDEYYLHNVDKRVQLIYEPYNYNRVLVTDGERLHFIAQQFNYVPGALADFKEGDRKQLNTYLTEKLQHTEFIGNERSKRDMSRADAEGRLQAGVLIKSEKQHAELVYQQTRLPQNKRELQQQQQEEEVWHQKKIDRYDNKTDFNQNWD